MCSQHERQSESGKITFKVGMGDKMTSDVRIAEEEVKKKTSRKQKAGNEQPLREQRELEKRQKHMGSKHV
jgi:hypothetical protein